MHLRFGDAGDYLRAGGQVVVGHEVSLDSHAVVVGLAEVGFYLVSVVAEVVLDAFHALHQRFVAFYVGHHAGEVLLYACHFVGQFQRQLMVGRGRLCGGCPA